VIQQVSDEVLRVEEGSLYPALHRLEVDGIIDSEWGVSSNNRRPKYYKLSRSSGTLRSVFMISRDPDQNQFLAGIKPPKP